MPEPRRDAVPILMPTWGLTLDEARILKWVKSPGEEVVEGEPVVVVETDKATGEVEAPVTGRLAAIVTPAGTLVHPGEVLGAIVPARGGG